MLVKASFVFGLNITTLSSSQSGFCVAREFEKSKRPVNRLTFSKIFRKLRIPFITSKKKKNSHFSPYHCFCSKILLILNDNYCFSNRYPGRPAEKGRLGDNRHQVPQSPCLSVRTCQIRCNPNKMAGINMSSFLSLGLKDQNTCQKSLSTCLLCPFFSVLK